MCFHFFLDPPGLVWIQCCSGCDPTGRAQTDRVQTDRGQVPDRSPGEVLHGKGLLGGPGEVREGSPGEVLGGGPGCLVLPFRKHVLGPEKLNSPHPLKKEIRKWAFFKRRHTKQTSEMYRSRTHVLVSGFCSPLHAIDYGTFHGVYWSAGILSPAASCETVGRLLFVVCCVLCVFLFFSYMVFSKFAFLE